jgi:DNA polymerase I-like protein with 3'-5' exonuclease and polymerase domains
MVPRTLPDLIETDLGDFRAALRGESLAVLDFETSDVRPRVAVVAGLGVYLPGPDRVFYLNVGHARREQDVPLWEPAALARVLRPFLRRRSNRIVMHNATFDLRLLLKLGLDVRCRVSDTLILTHRLDENLRSHSREPTYRAYLDHVGYGLKELTLIYFNRRPPTLHGTIGPRNTLSASPTEVARYCAQDVVNTFNLYARAADLLAADPLLGELVRTIDDPNHLPLARMMWEGVQIDADEARRQQDSYRRAIQSCREAVWETLGVDWPLDRPKDLLRVLRHLNFKEDLHYDPFADPWASASDPRDPGEDHDPSVTMELLEDLLAACDRPDKKLVVGLLLSRWQMQQRLSAFVSPLPELVRYTDNRLYLDRFASTLVTTRFSSSPNLQNLPKRADKVDAEGGWRSLLPPGCAESHKTRNLFVARPGHVLVSIDLSAAEPRYLAMLFQKALREKDEGYYEEVRELHARRWARYPDLLTRMGATQAPYLPQPCPGCGTILDGVRDGGRFRQHCIVCNSYPLEIRWPRYKRDPLWRVFRHGVPLDDPYNALLAALDPEGYGQAKAAGDEADWLEDNCWRGKKAFLALAYGSRAETLAPQLRWSVERTRQAIENLETEYATLGPLRELTLRRMIHLGMVRNLWGRPRRLNGYYQLAGTEPVTVRFYRHRPNPRHYLARIIPLGATRQGVQAFVQTCWVERADDRLETVLVGNTDGTLNYLSPGEPITRADHFNRPPFRNLNFAQIEWVKDEHGLIRYLPRQERGLRQAFNALCQSTGADHIRWLMNRVDDALRRAGRDDCKLILTVHDSLVYEVPEGQKDAVIRLVLPVVRKRPPWATFDIKADVEEGQRFGEMKKIRGV